MDTRETSAANQIVLALSQGLAVRSAAIVARGLRDLARDSNWLIKKVFSGHSPYIVASPTGDICALSPLVRQGTERLTLYDIERGVPTMALSVPGEPPSCPPGLPAVVAWSPTARYLIAAWGGWLPELHVFDLQAKMFVGPFGDFSKFPKCLAWSDMGRHFAIASGGGRAARLRIWEAAEDAGARLPFEGPATGEVGAPEWAEWPEWLQHQSLVADEEHEGKLSGFGRTAFSPDEGTLASVVEIAGEWADDSIVFLEVPTLRRQNAFQAQGHITDLSWTSDSRQILFCSAGQAFRLAMGSTEPELMPFGAELGACHPHLPLCLCFSSWLKNSAKGRLFLVDLNRLTVFDEYAADGVVNLRWSLDGSKAYAVTADGLAYIYEPPLL